MSADEKSFRKKARSAKLALWMAERGSYNRSPLDKLCRWLINRMTTVEPQKDWMRDPMVDQDTGYDADELERYQRGEIP